MNKWIKKLLVVGSLLTACVGQMRADKGMWLLNELTKENIAKMKELGFKLTPEQLYSLDKPSVASSVIIFGGGCSGVTVSATGLVMTNHHCGYDAIQQVSTVNHDYLRDGFVSQSYKEELPIEGLEVRYLAHIKDVTSNILGVLKNTKVRDEAQRQQLISTTIVAYKMNEEKKLGQNQEILIIPYYAGNKYYAITYDVFKDVRMVFAPPSSIGKFGGDTDNWMWPRHTGDFSVFRVYADKNNKPATYNKDNVPYKPKYFAEVSVEGVKAGDFAMTIGFPGSTTRYIPSWGVEDRMYNANAPRAEVRGVKQEVWKRFMNAEQAIRIKYASKYARSSNYWKNSIEMNKALQKLNIVGRKQAEEREFARWVQNHKNADYRNVLSELQKAYTSTGDIARRYTYLAEVFQGSEVLPFATMLERVQLSVNKPEAVLEHLRENFYKNYVPAVDQATMPALLDILRKKLSKEQEARIYADIDKLYKGNTKAFVDALFAKSFIPYEDKLTKALKESNFHQLVDADPIFKFASTMREVLTAMRAERGAAMLSIERGNRLYFAARREQDPKRPMPSDANFTMRMSYGSVKGYKPADAVTYDYFTTSEGILEKNRQDNPDYDVQKEYIQLLEGRNFGRWADPKTKKLPVAFLSTNDITGGNSGSPVFDKNGRVIGLAFDGNSEAMSGDIEFEPDLQRTISVDIRYVLYVIEKWGKCPRLIEELKLR